MFANESPVNEKKWMDHLRCIESFEQTPELVHSYIQRVFELRSYFSCDLVNAVVLLVGLVPHEWTANAEMVTDQESGLPGILYARATLSSTIWNVLAYYMYVIFNPNLIVDTYYWILGDESKAMSQMRHLADLNHDDPYLVFYVKPFQSFSSSSSIIML
ncbi:putative transmembrane protein [Gregarina niphandrodes]|uniref:Transmembrane protein n=1 Tax=Gregarina niphandrodes TaxID=110365 RepID=A0A023BCV3_GRENI|nr:putative transmembrane protein [Gregarina niphandrodes]EZG86315.1 putative transmembrane protein [Gregarina niphandrodes]|eukprot:XP_011128766.1 putative transmembrane protein [Gregarina niphandrodes]